MKQAQTQTKQRILEAADELFSEKGIDGTSMREIAKKANVNLSAINYHFTSKLNLCTEVLQESIKSYRRVIEKTIHNNWDLSFKKLCCEIFNKISLDSKHFATTFKIFFETNISEIFDNEDELRIGPPGSALLLQHLTKEIGENISVTKREWIVRTIFQNMDYMAIVRGSVLSQHPIHQQHFTLNEQTQDLELLIDALIGHNNITQ